MAAKKDTTGENQNVENTELQDDSVSTGSPDVDIPAGDTTGENQNVENTELQDDSVSTGSPDVDIPAGDTTGENQNVVMKKYRCVRRIFWQNVLIHVGDEVELDSSQGVPPNFELIK